MEIKGKNDSVEAFIIVVVFAEIVTVWNLLSPTDSAP